MRSTDTLVIGGGHAGLAVSRCLTERGRDHVVLERGRLAQRWRSERWDSLRLLTPNWMSRLPAWRYRGTDPDGYMTASEVVAYVEGYASSFGAPVEEGTTVEAVEPLAAGGYRVTTDRGSWTAADVVVATGACDRPFVPPVAAGLAASVHQVTTAGYRRPGSVPAGGVLVVGASASGVQIADELARAGRRVVLAVGSHSRLPRRYRGMDVMWWLDHLGVLAKTIDDAANPDAARREPSLQLVGRPTGENLDLGTLQERGVTLAGRLVGADGTSARFDDDGLGRTLAAADAQMRRVLGRIDRYVESNGLGAWVLEPEPVPPVVAPPGPRRLDLAAAGISTVLWATGYRRTYPWLRVPVLDRDGEIRQHRGVTPAPGLYVLGMRFQHRRDSSFIDGARHDASAVVDHLTARPRPRRHAAA